MASSVAVSTPSEAADQRLPPYFVTHPTGYTIKFGGRYINISILADHAGLSLAYVSRILSGKRDPPTSTTRKLSKLLGLTDAQFEEAVQYRVAHPKARVIEF